MLFVCSYTANSMPGWSMEFPCLYGIAENAECMNIQFRKMLKKWHYLNFVVLLLFYNHYTIGKEWIQL
jgi:hypothetical protein